MSWTLYFGSLIALAIGLRLIWEIRTKACYNPKAKMPEGWNQFGALNELKILIIGDQGSGDKYQKAVALAAEQIASARGADLVLLLGDNFIQEGVADLEDPQWQSKFEEIYRLDLPFFAVLGNHDFKGNYLAQIHYSEKNRRWRMPAATYQFEAGPVAFYAVNTTCSICSFWSLFKKTAQPWRVAFGHHPVLSSGRHGSMLSLERWVVKKSGVQFYLSGHHHLLEHIALEGLDQITSGAGGTNLNETAERDLAGKAFYRLDHGFVWAHFTQTQASFHFFDTQGEEHYQFSRS